MWTFILKANFIDLSIVIDSRLGGILGRALSPSLEGRWFEFQSGQIKD